MTQEIDNDDILFELQLTQKTSREVLSELKRISKPIPDDGVKDLLKAQIASLENIAILLSGLNHQAVAPEVNVVNDNSAVTTAVNKISERINELKDCMAEKPSEWVFTVTARNANGFIQTITAKAK